MSKTEYTHISYRSREFLDNLPDVRRAKLKRAKSAALGLYDQVGLYPHLIAEWHKSRVAVPLGGEYDALWDMYEVAPFTFQQIPQPEYDVGWFVPIAKVHLLRKDPSAERNGPSLGSIQVQYDGSLKLQCFSYRGFTDMVVIPGCKVRKKPWTSYNAWEMLVRDADERTKVAVRFDDERDLYQHWPDETAHSAK